MRVADINSATELRRYREERGMTRREFAEAMGYSYSHAVNMENGNYPISVTATERLARLELIEDTDNARREAFDKGYQLGREKGAGNPPSLFGFGFLLGTTLGVAVGVAMGVSL